MHLTILFLHQPSSNLQCFSNISSGEVCCSGNVDVLQRNRKCFFSRHVQFDSRFNVMTINEFSCNRPEVIVSFLIIPRRVVLKLGWRIQFIRISSIFSCSSPCSGRSPVTVQRKIHSELIPAARKIEFESCK